MKALESFAETRKAVQAARASHTVGQLWKLWLQDRAADGLSNRIYEFNWVSLGPVFGSKLPSLLKTQDFRDYARARFDAGRSPWTVNTELVRLRACLKWAHDHDHIAKRPKVWVNQTGAGRDRVLTHDEAVALVAGASEGDPHIYLFVVLAFATGARHKAILDLMWDRVYFIDGIIEYDEDLPPDPMSKAWRKGRATVPMNRLARAALERAYEGRQTDYVVEHGSRRLSSVKDGFKNAVERAAKVCATLGRYETHPTTGEQVFETDVTPHVIRHTVVTWLDERNVASKRTAQLVGHADERTTKRVYTHAAVEVLREAVDVLDEPFAPLPRIALTEVDSGEQQGATQPIVSQRDTNGASDRPQIEVRKGDLDA